MTKSQYKSVKTQSFYQNEKETLDRQHGSPSNSLEIHPAWPASSQTARLEAQCKWLPRFLPQEMLLDSYCPGAERVQGPPLVQCTPSTGEESEVKKGSGICLMS